MPFKSSGRGAYGPQGQKVIKGPLAPVWVTFSPGAVGTSAFSYTFVATDDSGDTPTYSVASGAVPTGLTLNSSTGVLSGTATASGTFTYTLRATDVNGRSTDTTSISQVVSLTLYAFTTATIGPNGNTGVNGCSVAQARASMGNPTWANTYLTTGSYTGWHSWTVPGTGTYRFVVAGSRGQSSQSRSGGNGAVITGTIALTQAEVLQLSFGQYFTATVSGGTNISGGGGGASFVYRNNTGLPIIVAGGGGGAGGNWNGSNQQTAGSNAGITNNGVPTVPNTSWTTLDNTQPTIGNGGFGDNGYDSVAGGGGWNSAGQNGGNSSTGGGRLSTGGVGGFANNDGTNQGGFGGGAGSRNVAGAGGGGYTGGNGASWTSAPDPGGGGGGGSWTGAGVTFESGAATNTGLGYITITKL
jgi:hypothetical protein